MKKLVESLKPQRASVSHWQKIPLDAYLKYFLNNSQMLINDHYCDDVEGSAGMEAFIEFVPRPTQQLETYLSWRPDF